MADKTVIAAAIKVETGNSAKTVGDLKKEIQGVSDGATSAGVKGSQGIGKLTDSFSSLSPAAKKATEGAGMLTNALNVLKAHPIIAVFAGLVGIVVALFQRFKNMEGVADSLGKAWGTLSGIFDKFINGILTPLIDGFVFLVDLFTNSLVAVLDKLGITSKATADRFGEITEALDDLEDAEKDAALAMAESNRKLQEAREIAGDANVPIKERIAALKEAGKIEKEELDKVVKMNQLKAQLTMESIAMELGARQGLIDMIKSGSLEQLKAARAELASLKNVDKEKLYAIDQMIIAAEDAGAKSAKVGKKTQSAITSLEKEEEDKREAERKAASDRAKAARDKANEERYQQEKAAQDQLKKIITEGERAIQDALKVLRVANRETELKELNAKYQADLAAAQAAGFGTLKITEAYQKQREEINKNYDAKDATAKSEKEKADEEKTLANQQKVLGGLTNYYAKDFALKEDNRKKDEEINKLRLAQQIEQAEAIQGILQNATTVFGKQTAVGKGIAIAEATISTYLGAAKALSGIQKGNPIGAVLAIAQAAAIVANGIKTVKAITAVQVPGGGGAGGSAPSISAPVLPQAATTTLNQGQINQIGNTAARAFVLETDVSGNQERIKRLNRAARIN
jgi:hypothetical protein